MRKLIDISEEILEDLQIKAVKANSENANCAIFDVSASALKDEINGKMDEYLHDQHASHVRTEKQLSTIRAAIYWARKHAIETIDKHLR